MNDGGYGMVQRFKDFNAFYQLRATNQKFAIFFSTTWDGSSRVIRPLFFEVAQAHATIPSYEVDIDSNVDIALEVAVRVPPVFKFYKNGAVIFEFTGSSPDKLREGFEKLSAS